jgi:tagatose-1,6-bisphosphate aldolase
MKGFINISRITEENHAEDVIILLEIIFHAFSMTVTLSVHYEQSSHAVIQAKHSFFR